MQDLVNAQEKMIQKSVIEKEILAMGIEDVSGRYQILKQHKLDWEALAENSREEITELNNKILHLDNDLEILNETKKK